MHYSHFGCRKKSLCLRFETHTANGNEQKEPVRRSERASLAAPRLWQHLCHNELDTPCQEQEQALPLFGSDSSFVRCDESVKSALQEQNLALISG